MRITSAGDLAAVVRGRRLTLHLSQAELARVAGVSRPWLSSIEAGKPSAEFGLIIRLLDSLNLSLQVHDAVPPGGEHVNLDSFLTDYENQ